MVDLCEKYAFRVYRWLRRRGNTGQSSLFRFGYDLYHGRAGTAVLDDLRRAILSQCPDKEFAAGFKEGTNCYAWYGLKYFLYEYEHHLAQERRLAVQMPWEVLTQKKNSIEHVLPQTMGGDGYWQTYFTPKEHQFWLHDIGNLTLTYDNSALSNRPFPAKQAIYSESSLFVERQLKDYPAWNVAQLRERREAIVTWALQRWHVTPPARPEVRESASGERKYSRGKIKALAEKNGVAEIYDKILALSEQYGLGTRPWAHCLTISPPGNGRYALIYIEPKPGRLSIGIWVGNFPQFFGITIEEIQAVIGSDHWFQVEKANVGGFLATLETLFLACGLAES